VRRGDTNAARLLRGTQTAPSPLPPPDAAALVATLVATPTRFIPTTLALAQKISDQRHGGSSKLKSDATYFTIADGIVQHMFIKHLFAGNKFAQIVGEEDESVINILEKPYTVDDLTVPDEFNSIIAATLKEIDQLSARIDPNLYKTMTVFVDPIDGTREFATAQGEYVTILIGYNDAVGHPAAGIMYRPLTSPVTWAAGAASEEVVMGLLDYADPPVPNGMLITDGQVSPFIVDLIDELGYERVSSVASGNRAMMLLEGKGGAYIRDTGGFAKWDTSAPTAVLEAYGGTMSKLPPFLDDASLVGYTHLKSEKNLDFVPGAAHSRHLPTHLFEMPLPPCQLSASHSRTPLAPTLLSSDPTQPPAPPSRPRTRVSPTTSQASRRSRSQTSPTRCLRRHSRMPSPLLRPPSPVGP